jgi:hypothetical protein
MFVKRALVMALVSIFMATAAYPNPNPYSKRQSPVRMMPSAFAALTSPIMRKFTPAC